MPATVNLINWFEIPVVDMARAKKFYEAALGTEISLHEINGRSTADSPQLAAI